MIISRKYMKIVSLICFAILFHTCVSAQTSLATPLNFEPGIAKTNNISRQFLIAFPDTLTQIFLNPAAAHKFSKQFSYLSYFGDLNSEYPDYQKFQSSFSSFSLFKAFDSKYLLKISYNCSLDEDISGVPIESDVFSFGTSNYNFYFMQVHITNISEIADNDLAFGIFFNAERFDADDISKRNGSVIIFGYEHFNYEWDGIKNNYTKYQFGIEYGLINDLLNIHGNISLQKTKSETENSLITNWRNVSTSDASDYASSYLQKSSIVDYNPLTLSFSNTLCLKPHFISNNDYFSIDISGYYSNSNLLKSIKDIREYYDPGNPYASSYYYANESGSPEKIWNFNSALGYSFRNQISDAYLISGFQARLYTFNNSVYDANNSSYNQIFSSHSKYKVFEFSMPLFISYSPTKHISIWGGITYNYYLSKNNIEAIEEKQIHERYNTESEFSELINSRSRLKINLGIELFNNEGVNASILFGESFLEYKKWNVSFGYHF